MTVLLAVVPKQGHGLAAAIYCYYRDVSESAMTCCLIGRSDSKPRDLVI
jgi:hypothetical protein